LNEEFDAEEDGPAKFVLNIASQEYAKAVELSALRAPVITVQFPGPSVHAKTARGEMARFCATEAVCCAEQLKGFTGTHGEWSFVSRESSESLYVFHRGAAKAQKPVATQKKQPAAVPKGEAPKSQADAEEDAPKRATRKRSRS